MSSNASGTILPASLLLLTYNHEGFVEAAARACLNQDCEPIEIIFSDDASTDATFEILSALAAQYDGPHKLTLRRNTTNLGISAHYNRLVALAMGDLLITAAGDDISMPNRVGRLLETWRKNDRPPLVSSGFQAITLKGDLAGEPNLGSDLSRWKTADAWCKKRPRVVGATHAFTKKLWTVFGPLNEDIHYEDQVMSLRSCCLGGGINIPEALILYREGGVSSAEPRDRKYEDKIAALKTRFSRQRAVYAQVRTDLKTMRLEDLWLGKVRRYWERADTGLWVIAHRDELQGHLYALFGHIRRSGLFWTLRLIYKVTCNTN